MVQEVLIISMLVQEGLLKSYKKLISNLDSVTSRIIKYLLLNVYIVS